MTFSYTPSATTWPARAATGIATSNGWRERHPGDHVVRPRLRPGTVRLLPARDCAAVFFKEWVAHQNSPLEYSNGTAWDRMPQKGILLLERSAQDDRVRIRQPRRNLHYQVHAVSFEGQGLRSPTSTPAHSIRQRKNTSKDRSRIPLLTGENTGNFPANYGTMWVQRWEPEFFLLDPLAFFRMAESADWGLR